VFSDDGHPIDVLAVDVIIMIIGIEDPSDPRHLQIDGFTVPAAPHDGCFIR
jgi:hypothetical protein